jgi:hypothetical protein
MMLVVMVVGLVMMSRFGGPMGGVFGPFIIIWVLIGLVGAGMAFYNAFSEEGLPLYELDVEEEEGGGDWGNEDKGPYCPQCGKPVEKGDQFCRHCGASLDG